MTWIVLVVLTILALVTVSFMVMQSSVSSLAGVKVDLPVLGGEELLMSSCDLKPRAMIDEKHKEVAGLVAKANASYWPQRDLKATLAFLIQAVKCYEAIRDQANSAVVELNLAILAKARLKVEQELGAHAESLLSLKKYVNKAHKRADRFLKDDTGRYDGEVATRLNNLVSYNDGIK